MLITDKLITNLLSQKNRKVEVGDANLHRGNVHFVRNESFYSDITSSDSGAGRARRNEEEVGWENVRSGEGIL